VKSSTPHFAQVLKASIASAAVPTALLLKSETPAMPGRLEADLITPDRAATEIARFPPRAAARDTRHE
jgi:hypothetical protein